jgi:hypothetical protein
VAIVALVLGAGAVNGVGPLARTTPPSEVTDPREMLARSMQAVIDASSVHVGASVIGTVPGALVGRSQASVALDGTLATLDLRPQDARTHLVLGSLSLNLNVEAITSWDTMAYRIGNGAWTKGSLASVVAGTGIDANPLTLVDRIRKELAKPDAPRPSWTDVACDAPSGFCRQVSIALGPDAGALVLKAFPNAGSVNVGPTTTTLVLLTDALTLRPAHLLLASRSADGSLSVTMRLDFSLWGWPSVIPDPPSG